MVIVFRVCKNSKKSFDN